MQEASGAGSAFAQRRMREADSEGQVSPSGGWRNCCLQVGPVTRVSLGRFAGWGRGDLAALRASSSGQFQGGRQRVAARTLTWGTGGLGWRNPHLHLASGVRTPFLGDTTCSMICLSSFWEPKAQRRECF